MEYFHEMQLKVSEYAKYLNKYVCFHYKYHLSQYIYLINAEKTPNHLKQVIFQVGKSPILE